MTKAESEEIKQARNRQEYLRRRERKKEYARRYYREHAEYIAQKQRERRKNEVVKEYTPLSTEALEESLPYGLRKCTSRLRRECLSIHITQRPPYDYYLRCQTVEYFRSLFGSEMSVNGATD